MSAAMIEWERIARECGTDKGIHTYMPTYERLLGQISGQPVKLLELGIDHGNSLKFWLKMFPLANIYAMDSMTLGEVTDSRLTVYQRFQQDPAVSLLFPANYFDVIVDDGGHEAPWQRISKTILWPNLKVGGLYFIEDILTDAYPDEFGNWQKHPDYLYGECNRRNAFEAYDRADCIVVLKKTVERERHPLADDSCLRHPRWPAFFKHMDSLAEPPVTGRAASQPGIYWGWLEQPLWRPMWEKFLS